MYLIVIFVGLVLVIFAGVCLSACCCRGEILDFAPPSFIVDDSFAIQPPSRTLCAAHATCARVVVDLVRSPVICVKTLSLTIPFQRVWSALAVVSALRASSSYKSAIRGPNSMPGPTFFSLAVYGPSRASLLRSVWILHLLIPNCSATPILTFFYPFRSVIAG